MGWARGVWRVGDGSAARLRRILTRAGLPSWLQGQRWQRARGGGGRDWPRREAAHPRRRDCAGEWWGLEGGAVRMLCSACHAAYQRRLGVGPLLACPGASSCQEEGGSRCHAPCTSAGCYTSCCTSTNHSKFALFCPFAPQVARIWPEEEWELRSPMKNLDDGASVSFSMT